MKVGAEVVCSLLLYLEEKVRSETRHECDLAFVERLVKVNGDLGSPLLCSEGESWLARLAKRGSAWLALLGLSQAKPKSITLGKRQQDLAEWLANHIVCHEGWWTGDGDADLTDIHWQLVSYGLSPTPDKVERWIELRSLHVDGREEG
jgi:hypothetical protein